ncbi:uncharacterized protein LOC125188198 [Salvia hispanica]|uniref:uncharacterized protein LOC125188198 n=1 Tax=Salvia hispanica TaxID=49212 RepID=UPI002009B160|nr:uncharacterized protein LOC125188198 [Salvia hispanica]
MVVALGPGKFYGVALPRPRLHTDAKLSDERVDPPPSVTDPLISWAREAHWSMGGLSVHRRRLQGRIEGSVERLRAQRDQISTRSPIPTKSGTKSAEIGASPSPPRAPAAIKRRRVVGLTDGDEEEVIAAVKRGLVRKLGDDFERVARESEIGSAERISSGEGKKKLVKGGAAASGIRRSPRLSKMR